MANDIDETTNKMTDTSATINMNGNTNGNLNVIIPSSISVASAVSKIDANAAAQNTQNHYTVVRKVRSSTTSNTENGNASSIETNHNGSIENTGSVNNHMNHYHHHQHLHHHHRQPDPSSKNFYHAPPDRLTMPSMNFLQSQSEEDDGLGPLPPKWEKAYTENGETYFIDHNTGTSHWLDPRLSKFQKKSLEDCMDDELPYGWEKIHDPQYGTYFIDHVNRRTQYENPVLEAKRRSSERQRNRSNQSNSSNTMTDDQSKMRQNDSQSQQSQIEQQSKPNFFTKNPSDLRGERINTTLLKSSRGLGFTIVGGDDNIEEFLQIKSIVANGPAWLDGKLQTGDILVYVNDTCVLGFTHHEMVNVFQSILPGETVTLEVCRGYPLPFDPNDPNTEVVTTIAVDGLNTDPEKSRILMDLNMDGNYNFLDISDTTGGNTTAKHNSTLSRLESSSVRSDISENYANETKHDILPTDKPEILNISIMKGPLGFGFTIADSAYGQKVKKILDRNCCKDLNEGDYLLAINNTNVMYMSHSAVVQVLKNCPKSEVATLKIQRGSYFNGNINDKPNRLKQNAGDHRSAYLSSNKEALNLYRSKTPTADLYSTQPKEILPTRSKTPLVDTRSRAKTPLSDLNGGDDDDDEEEVDGPATLDESHIQHLKNISTVDTKSNNSFPDQDSINNEAPFIDPFPKLVLNLSDRLAEASLMQQNSTNHYQTKDHPNIRHNQHFDSQPNLNNYEQNSVSSGHDYYVNYNSNVASGYTNSPSNSIYAASGNTMPPHMKLQIMAPVPTYHHDHCYCFECQRQYRYHNVLIDRRKVGFSPLDTHAQMASPHQLQMNQQQQSQQMHQLHHESNYWTKTENKPMPQTSNFIQQPNNLLDNYGYLLSEVTLERQPTGFGFRIVGGTEEGSQVTVGHIVPHGAADANPRIETGDEILSIDGHNVVQSSHHRVVQLMGEAAQRGRVTMILRRRVNDPNMVDMSHQQRDPIFPYDVVVSRNENESFGFVIISATNQYYGSTIGKLIAGSPADRCEELKVGDRIIAVNRIDIAGMSHGDVVNLIKESGLQVRLTIGNPKEVQPNMTQQPQQTLNTNNNLNDPYFEQHRNNGLISITNDNLNADAYQLRNH